jgi:hypothetical protein
VFRILRLALLLLLLLLLFPAPPRPDENERFCRPRRSANRLARKRFFVDLVDGIVGIVYWALDVPYTSARPEWVTCHHHPGVMGMEGSLTDASKRDLVASLALGDIRGVEDT